ncbi:MAG: VWA domain-containing protein [Planctomycetes bacterium]|nr:VWA domain-containing protein [Planctomycetota bacterium]
MFYSKIQAAIATAILLASLPFSASAQDKIVKPIEKGIDMEIVFCVDTTGSMGGLIEGAKVKVWSIVNEIIKQKPTPSIKIGLIAYRDQGDSYVTQVFDLSDDLDATYKNLLTFSANGGGDTPEHVNKALDDAVTQIKWSEGPDALKVIYLVGDAPPHMDYNDGFDYHKTTENAVKKYIYINTIRCGNDETAGAAWQEIARLGEGKFFSIDATGGMIAITTPMDKELTELSSKLTSTLLAYGDAGEAKMKDMEKMDETMSAPASSSMVVAGAARAELMADKGFSGKDSEYDLLEAVKANSVKLEEVKPEDLPEEMRKMTLDEKKTYLTEKEKEREAVKTKIAELSKKRAEYIQDEMKKLNANDENAFDKVVVKNLQEMIQKKQTK